MTERYDVADTGAEGEEAAEFFEREKGDTLFPEVTVYVFRNDEGVLSVQVDVPEEQRVRVFLNDGSVFDQHTGTGEDFGDEAHGTEPTDWKRVASQHGAVLRGEADFVVDTGEDGIEVVYVARGEIEQTIDRMRDRD